MYAMRFPGEDTSGITMQQLRGREGARIRKVYRTESSRTGVTWDRRTYDVEAFEDGDAVNQALSAANTSLYGVVHSVIVALGCSPGLGFVHTGHVRSFVYDVADLYKAELTIPLAFDLAAQQTMDMGGAARRALRDKLHGSTFLTRCVRDIQHLLLPDADPDALEEGLGENIVQLWDGSRQSVAGGTAYGDDD
jgi:CRISPR-associated protein Cas1